MGAKAKSAAGGAAAGGAMLLALGIWVFSEGDGPKRDPDTFVAYQDIAKVWTICHGHTGDVKPGQTATKAECDRLAKSDLGKGFAAEDLYVTRVMELPVWTRAAVADFAANIGAEAFRGSSVLRLLNARDIGGACRAMLLWTKARAGPMGTLVVVRGLINRRLREQALCNGQPWN
jgi:lysozyme